MNNKDLPISQLVLASEIDGREIIPFDKDNANGGLLVSLLIAAFREGMATQAAVNGKQNKLIPGYGIEITPENEIRTKLDVSPFKIVDELPTSEIENKIYLVPDPDGQSGKNEYIEYLWDGNHWEELGKFAPSVDLAPYQKAADAERIYVKKADMPNMEEYAKVAIINALAEQVATLTTQLATAQTKLNTIPAIPLSDGKCYALKNGEWVVIADITEAVLTSQNDFSDTPSVGE